MPSSTAAVTLPQAERVLFKMCKHFAIKVPVAFDSDKADIDFRIGRCRVQRQGELLQMRCDADDTERLERVQYIIDEHLVLMARDKQLVVAWQAA